MCGISDLDFVCLTEIFQNLAPMDLCSIRQCSKRLRHFVDGHLHSFYFVREQFLDLTKESIRNVDKILKHLGKFVRLLKVGEKKKGNLMLDVIANNCSDILKGLTLNRLHLYNIDMQKFGGVFENLEIIELIDCEGGKKSFENFLLQHEYPNLTTLRKINLSDTTKLLEKFFMRKRNVKKLSCSSIRGDLLPLIALNATEIEELQIEFNRLDENIDNLLSLAQCKKLKRLQIFGHIRDKRTNITALIKELSVTTELQMIGINNVEFDKDMCDAISKLTNLKELRLRGVTFTFSGTTSKEMLGRKLSTLESLTLEWCNDFPYRNFLASVYKSDIFRTVYVGGENNFIAMMVKALIDQRYDRCFVPLYIYLHNQLFDEMKELLTQDNLKLIEKYGNIKIIRADDGFFFNEFFY